MSDKWILDERGEPVTADLMTWAQWFESTDKRRVAHDTLSGGGYVSTVFLGIDHSFGHGPPVLWETMVFGGPLDEEQVRYTSREDALAGHRAMVERAIAAPGKPSVPPADSAGGER